MKKTAYEVRPRDWSSDVCSSDHNENIDKTVENIKKLGLSYFLVDLNAATIDRDPRHDLTRRYENLLATFTSDNLELVETDSICLKIALEDYKKSKKSEQDLEDYIYNINCQSPPLSPRLHL